MKTEEDYEVVGNIVLDIHKDILKSVHENISKIRDTGTIANSISIISAAFVMAIRDINTAMETDLFEKTLAGMLNENNFQPKRTPQ